MQTSVAAFTAVSEYLTKPLLQALTAGACLDVGLESVVFWGGYLKCELSHNNV